MSQNVCLICCYSFPEKRNRFISEEAEDAFPKFCRELGVSCGRSLGLPYGENVTVCGDCLSLVVLYVQRKTIQKEKEAKLIELQEAVCVALKELQEVVEEVQVRIDQLHSTVQTGDEACLYSFCRGSADKENSPLAFRSRVLKLNTGLIQRKSRTHHRDDYGIPINIKVEPREEDNGPRFITGDDTSTSFGQPDFQPNRIDIGGNKVDLSRSRKEETIPNDLIFDTEDDFHPPPDFDDSDNDSNYSDNLTDTKKRRTSAKQNPSKKLKTGKPRPGYKRYNVEHVSQRTASQWKDDLVGRVIQQMNNDINESNVSSQMKTETPNDNEEASSSDSANALVSSSFQFKDGQLILRGIVVNILEEHRALQCTKCGKKVFEARDVTGNSQLETIMRDHILWKHYDCSEMKRRYDKLEWVVVDPPSQTDLERDWRLWDSKQRQSFAVNRYYCAHAKMKKACGMLLQKKVYANGDVEWLRTEREHRNHRDEYFGLIPEQKRFVQELFLKHVTKPNEIIRFFKKEGKEVPPKSKLISYLVSLRRKVTT